MNLLDFILNIFFPNVCGFCGKIEETSLCDKCFCKIKPKLLYEIKKDIIHIMPYEGEFRNMILNYKFKDKSYLYKTFSKIILNNEKICKILKTYDIIIPVPIHKLRQKERGYNQSALIAKSLAKSIQSIKYADALKKVKNNLKQSSLNKEERIENVKNAYKVTNKEIIFNKKVILFDDIYTTGATAKECAKTLKERGAKEVLILSLAKAEENN